MNTTKNIFSSPISMKELVRKTRELKITGGGTVTGGDCCGPAFDSSSINELIGVFLGKKKFA